MVSDMSNQLQVKGLTDELKERLSASAARNFRSLNQEALARIQFSYEVEDSLRAAALEKKIDEGLNAKKSPGSVSRLRELAAKGRAGAR
jgi:hypothetical protein